MPAQTKPFVPATTSVLGTILARLGAIEAAQYIAPSTDPSDVNPEDIVGSLNDEGRRIFTLRHQLATDYQTRVKRLRELNAQIAKATDRRKGLGGLLDLLGGGLSKEAVTEAQTLVNELPVEKAMLDLASALLSQELFQQFPRPDGKTVLIVYSDWTAVWGDKRPSPFDMDDDLPPGLRHLLEGIMGSDVEMVRMG